MFHMSRQWIYIVCGLKQKKKIHSIWFWVFAFHDKWWTYLQAWSVRAVVANARCSSKRLTIDISFLLFFFLVKRPWDRIKNPIVFLAFWLFLALSMHRTPNINYGHLFSLVQSFIYYFFLFSLRSNTCSETDFVCRWLMHTLDRFVQHRRRHRRRPMPWLIWRTQPLMNDCWNDWILFIHELGRFFSVQCFFFFMEYAVGACNVRMRIRRRFSNRKLRIDNSYCLEKWVWTELFVCVGHIFFKWRSETNQIGTHNYVIRYVKNVQT